MKLLVLGDTHIGAGVATYGPERLADFEDVLTQVVRVIAGEEPDVVLFLGDAFESRHPRPDELLVFQRFVRQVRQLAPMFGVVGNHDVSTTSTAAALELFDLGVYREPGVVMYPAAGQPDTVGLAFLPWTPLSRLVSSQGRHEGLQERAAELLIDTAQGLREQIDGPAVLLAHWSVSGASLPNGLSTDTLAEVVLPLGELEAQGWDAICLGHIHRAQSLNPYYPDATDGQGVGIAQPYPASLSFYVGSPMPLNHGEAASPHGVWLLDVTEGRVHATFKALDSRPFRTTDIDLTPIRLDEDLTALVIGHAGVNGDITDSILRVRVTCTEEQQRRLDVPRVKAALLDGGAFRVSVECQVERVSRARVDGLDETLEPLDGLRAWAESQGLEPGERDRLGAVMVHGLQEIN